MRIPLIALLLVSTLPACSVAQEPGLGKICGTVQNERGEPAQSVKIMAIYMGGHSGPYSSGTTDNDGHYCISGVRPGDYELSADDVEKGYPQLGNTFYGDASAKVEITPQELTAHLDWRIPYRAGTLHIQLTDANTGKMILPMFYDMKVKSDQTKRRMYGSMFSSPPLLVPPDQEILLSIRAPNYSKWSQESENGIVRLAAGSEHTLQIVLVPIQH